MTVAPKLFTGVSETLLIPLAARARAGEWYPFFRDSKAEEILQALQVDTGPFEKDRWTMMAAAIRAHLIDEAVRDFMARHDKVLLLNLGAGLCTRFFRVDDGRLRCFDLDLPQVIDVKRRFLPETERYRYLARSVFDFGWSDEVDRAEDEAVIMVIEGVLMYFDENHCRRFFNHCAEAFPGAELLFDYCDRMAARYSPVASVLKTDARFKSGFSSFEEAQALEPRMRHKRLYSLTLEMSRFSRLVRTFLWLPGLLDAYMLAHVAFQ